MGNISYMEFQKFPLKFHTKYLTHALKDVSFKWKCTSSFTYELVVLKRPFGSLLLTWFNILARMTH